MINFFKKKNLSVDICTPVAGEVHELSDASDPVFQGKMMGDGFYVLPEEMNIFSPIKGKIESIFPTKHALTIKGTNGINLLIHIGSDTVQLEGKPFEVLIEVGQNVQVGELLVIANFEYIKEHIKGAEVYVVFPELANKKEIKLMKRGLVGQGNVVASICE